jgi:hypothetical protein
MAAVKERTVVLNTMMLELLLTSEEWNRATPEQLRVTSQNFIHAVQSFIDDYSLHSGLQIKVKRTTQ